MRSRWSNASPKKLSNNCVLVWPDVLQMQVGWSAGGHWQEQLGQFKLLTMASKRIRCTRNENSVLHVLHK
jgi:hypothetical protein